MGKIRKKRRGHRHYRMRIVRGRRPCRTTGSWRRVLRRRLARHRLSIFRRGPRKHSSSAWGRLAFRRTTIALATITLALATTRVRPLGVGARDRMADFGPLEAKTRGCTLVEHRATSLSP
ncbi:hypothetical protein F5148DRAFT_1377775 [Russula earlei]|uniref:Uncharacterized protein n=1 Tax=Russula earlei TaxID=71964 RepID=A0ACC0U318_9AGAM|nr:hypothetical protein F5148DRAFT_1377775 [Russula earlei]